MAEIIMIVGGDHLGFRVRKWLSHYFIVTNFLRGIRLDETTVESYTVSNKVTDKNSTSKLLKNFRKRREIYGEIKEGHPILVKFRNGDESIILADEFLYKYFVNMQDKIDSNHFLTCEEQKLSLCLSNELFFELLIILLVFCYILI